MYRHVLSKVEHFDQINLSDNTFATPTMIMGGGVMLCREGECTIIINAKPCTVRRWDLVAVSPYSIIQIESVTADFECMIMGAQIDFFSQVKLPDKGRYFIDITSRPSISLTEYEVEELLTLRALLQREEQNCEQPFFEDIYTSILRIITLKVFAIYSSRESNESMVHNRNSEILNKFILDLLEYGSTERKLEFYAQRQSLTASYLSRCVKDVAGKGASEVLIDYVINNIKSALLESNKTILEISEEFNFCSNSSFSQYFKKYTSLSPKEYRRRFIS